ncbi:MAG: hypothetical protein OEM58_03930 [Nitrospirota bacterium]|nr:hypothetical protein [Nitrospirota bacterium]
MDARYKMSGMTPGDGAAQYTPIYDVGHDAGGMELANIPQYTMSGMTPEDGDVQSIRDIGHDA